MNTYNIENETCPHCKEQGEMTYSDYVGAIHCACCGNWFTVSGELINEEKEEVEQ